MAKAAHKLAEPDANCKSKFNVSTGFLWRAKRDAKNKRASRTAGTSKGENCHASMMDRYMSKRNRSYKHKAYRAWCEKITKGNK